jgi:hypothetical protein
MAGPHRSRPWKTVRLNPPAVSAAPVCGPTRRTGVAVTDLLGTAHLSVRDAARVVGVLRSIVHRARVSRKTFGIDVVISSGIH